MVVETRSWKKKGATETTMTELPSSSHMPGLMEEPPSSVSSSSTTLRSILSVQAEHARKLAAMERTALERERERENAIMERDRERERMILEHERVALDLEAQIQIAALEEKRSRGSRRSSILSNRDVHNWLDQCLDSALPSNVVVEPSQNAVPSTSQQALGCTLDSLRPGTIPKCSNHVVNTRPPLAPYCVFPVPTNASGTRPQVPLPCTTAQQTTSFGDTRRVVAYQETPNFNPNPVGNMCPPRTHDNLPTNHNNKSDITLLAEIITSLANKQQLHIDGRLPMFDGKPLDWLSFQRAFEDTKQSYSDSSNLARINVAVKGAAREAIAVLLVSARDPNEVMSALQLRFGRPELVVLKEISVMRTLPKVSFDNNDLHKFACRVCNCVEVIKLLNQRAYLDSPELFQTILSKLTPLLRARWLDFGASNFEIQSNKSKLELLASFLAREVDLQLNFGLLSEPIEPFKKSERIHTTSETLDTDTVLPTGENINTAISFTESRPWSKIGPEAVKACLFCTGEHCLQFCDKFLSMSVSDRWQFVKDKKLCHKCLNKGAHSYRYCKASKDICMERNCSRRHHKLLHIGTSFPVTHTIIESGTIDENSSGGQSTEVVAHTGADTTTSLPSTRQSKIFRPLLKIAAVTVTGPAGSVDTFALLDDGSTTTFIEEDIASKIGVQGPPDQIRIDCVGGLSKNVNVQYVDFLIKGRTCTESHVVTKARAISSLGLSRQTVSDRNIKEFTHLSDLSSELCYENVQPTILIGIDNWHLTISQTTRKGSKSQPVAIKTPLGWVLFGFSCSKTKPVAFINKIYETNTCEAQDYNPSDMSSVEALIREQYSLDSIGISKNELRSQEDERAISILENTANRLPSGRFEVGLLWKSDKPIVPNSLPLAYSRFLNLERKMIKDHLYAERYKQNIHDLLKKGYAEKCQVDSPTGSVCWYLPHFGVTNPNKPGKLRVVSDAAAKVDGISLNSLLLTGPDLLRSLFDILLRFREGKVALVADIKEMFPQFKIIKRDRDAQRFLWRDTPDKPIGFYRMSSMVFGAVSSPFTAMFLKNKNAFQFKDLFPQAVTAIVEDTYMDDYIGSVDSVNEASILAKDIVEIHSRAGLEMRGWVSNEPAALSKLPKQLLATSMTVELGSTPSCLYTRTLGLIWDLISDTIAFNIPTEDPSLPYKITKRIILSFFMRVFDPLGILAPVTIRGRILFQNIWRIKLEWDECLPLTEIAAWNVWYSDLRTTSQLHIPRCYNRTSQDYSQIELHVFADASEQAYAAVAYWRFVYPNGDVQLSLICSKSRVAPLKPSSIPRLELQAALIAARLAHSIKEACRTKPCKTFFWTDSMNVLGWLRNDARRFKPFVAQRVGEIIELTDVSEWRWVSGDLNVADDATRLKRGPLILESRWISGPEFLKSSDWPTEPISIILPTLEQKPPQRVKIHFINDVVPSSPISAESRRFSSWLRLIRATAFAHKYLTILRIRTLRKKGIIVDPSTKVEGLIVTFDIQASSVTTGNGHNVSNHGIRSTLASEDIILAEFHVFRKCQIDSFPEELNCIRSSRPLPRHSCLNKLPGFLDKYQILRLSSRIVAASEVGDNVKTPIILDGKHPSVRLLILRLHCKAAHANTEMVVNELRQHYWILNLRNTVRSVIYHCCFCQIRRATTTVPVMGNLPAARLQHHCRPFSFLGLDYFGPILVTIGRRKEKRWVALYTCFSTRAIHLEVVYSLSTDAAIMSLRRFIARRGTPIEIYSDNGTAFVGVNRVLKSLYGEAVEDYAACEKIKWKFLPPSAPFMAGATERMVKSVKTALKVTLNTRSPSDEVLSTLLCEAETLVNSRPLTHVASDPDYPEGLTPNHFLLGSSSGRPIPATVENNDLCSRYGWKRAVRMADHFWQRWIKEYLPTLSPARFQGTRPTFAVGDQVLIADGNLPRGSWPRGRISALYPGADGIVRVVDITTRAGVLRRPVRKVVPLPS